MLAQAYSQDTPGQTRLVKGKAARHAMQRLKASLGRRCFSVLKDSFPQSGALRGADPSRPSVSKVMKEMLQNQTSAIPTGESTATPTKHVIESDNRSMPQHLPRSYLPPSAGPAVDLNRAGAAFRGLGQREQRFSGGASSWCTQPTAVHVATAGLEPAYRTEGRWTRLAVRETGNRSLGYESCCALSDFRPVQRVQRCIYQPHRADYQKTSTANTSDAARGGGGATKGKWPSSQVAKWIGQTWPGGGTW